MSSESAPVHIVFATTGPYSHAPPLIRLAMGLVQTDPKIFISIIIHINNVTNATRLLSSIKDRDEVYTRIKLYPVGAESPLKDITKTYTDMLFHSGPQYATILADTSRPAPAVFLFDITSFFYVQVKEQVEKNFPHITPPKIVGYNPQPASELLFVNGSEEYSIRWFADALRERGIDPLNMDLPMTPEQYAGWSEKTNERVEQGKVVDEVFTGNDRIVNIPGVPPLHLYEYWSVPIDWSKLEHHGLLQYFASMQAASYKPEAWLVCFPSSVFEPEAFEAVKKDKVIAQGGEKPVIEVGWYEIPPVGLDEEIKSFLDQHEERSVVYVSFGTVVDAGEGVNVLFEELAEQNVPIIFAGGNQLDHLPAETRQVIDAAVEKDQALAPDWCDQIGVLSHPSIMCFVSHCGANSTVEAILAEVPILTWSKRMDQIIIGSQVGARTIGIELIQHREGLGVGKTVAHLNTIVERTPEALKAEIKQALTDLQGQAGVEIRANLRAMAAAMREKRTGEWDKNVKEFIQWARATA